MIEKTPALALRIVPYSRTSHIVTWLAPDTGLVGTMIKGACRRNSPFVGRYDLYYRCELLYYAREHGGLHIARECAPLAPRPALREDWRAAVCASYAADMLLRCSTEGGNHEALFQLGDRTFDLLAGGAHALTALYGFETALLQALGLAPRLDHCRQCGRPLDPGEGARLDAALGGLYCRSCPPPPGAAPVQATPDVLTLLRRWQQPVDAPLLRRTVCSSNQLLALHNILGSFLSFHAELAPGSRDVAVATLMRPASGRRPRGE
jgi:DNA repair protein RecO (recombination protein O)